MTDIIKCLGFGCPWKKECVRFQENPIMKTAEAVYISPWSKEGCPYFLTDELLKEKNESTMGDEKN